MRRTTCLAAAVLSWAAVAWVATTWSTSLARADAPAIWQIDLVDGGRIVGPLSTHSIEIVTEFGALDVPVGRIAEARPGFVSRPEWQRRVDGLIAELADDKAATREQAERSLRELGPRVGEVLQEARLDDEAERRQRVRRLLSALPDGAAARAWPRQDIVTTAKQRFAGKIATQHIEIRAAWGNVRVRLADVELLSPPASRRQVDLLKEIDLDRHAIAGAWNWQGAALVSSPSSRARVQIPIAPPEQYELHVTATPISGRKIRGKEIADSLFLGVVVAGRQSCVAIDAFTDIGGPFTGLDTLDGKRTHQTPLHKGRLLQLGREAEIYVRVQREGVALSVDGAPVFAWQGDSRRLSVTPDWRLGDSRFLGVGSHQTTYKIGKMRLVPIDDPPPMENLKPGDWTVTLRDGSLVAGSADEKQAFSFGDGEQGDETTSVVLADLRRVRLSGDGKTLQLEPLAGAARSVPLASPAKIAALALETRFGPIAVPLAQIREAAAAARGGNEASGRQADAAAK